MRSGPEVGPRMVAITTASRMPKNATSTSSKSMIVWLMLRLNFYPGLRAAYPARVPARLTGCRSSMSRGHPRSRVPRFGPDWSGECDLAPVSAFGFWADISDAKIVTTNISVMSVHPATSCGFRGRRVLHIASSLYRRKDVQLIPRSMHGWLYSLAAWTRVRLTTRCFLAATSNAHSR
jgi:hypothetical protein